MANPKKPRRNNQHQVHGVLPILRPSQSNTLFHQQTKQHNPKTIQKHRRIPTIHPPKPQRIKQNIQNQNQPNRVKTNPQK